MHSTDSTQDTSSHNATSEQFKKLVLRMMPKHIADSGEGKLIAAILSQAWADSDKHSSRRFFTEKDSWLHKYCEATGLNAQQLRELFAKHNGTYKRYQEIAV